MVRYLVIAYFVTGISMTVLLTRQSVLDKIDRFFQRVITWGFNLLAGKNNISFMFDRRNEE